MTSNESEVRALLDNRVAACQTKDIDRLMSLYSSDIVYYDVVPPLQYVGTEEVRRNFVRWFDGYDGPIGLETHDLTIATSGDVAVANMLHLDTGTRPNGLQTAIWVRATVCCRRSGDKWLITQEHISVPINPENLQAWLASEKDQPA
ncbi:YybH family protein [Sphaerisporangium fuscum]|uniref:YybH family protein n=1 Tax=Sphaerisporangium fuscum TaxID=2835868 RepID=UPI001BDDAF13|nr:nuclear transport factor 2 family protein [Sphaerisporangium fuscum]